MFDFDAFKIPVPDYYDSPLKLIVDKISTEIAEQTDNMVCNAISKCGVDIDKDKLVSILQQDQQRYRDAYTKGYMDAMSRFTEAFNRVFSELTQGETPEDL